MRIPCLALLLCLPACVGSGGPGTSPADLAAQAPCKAQAASTLAGVSLAVQGPCTLTQAQALAGVTYPYQLVITSPIDQVVPKAEMQTCPTPDRSGLYLFGQISGGGQTYCRCDNGLCPAPGMQPVTLPAGTFPGSFDWRGRNWFGPSDTGNPEGAPFPAGTYTLRIRTSGTVAGTPFEVSVVYPIVLVP